MIKKLEGNLFKQAKVFLIGFGIAALIAVLIMAGIGIVGIRYADEISRYSYARGLYDTCVAVGVNYFNAPLFEARVRCLQSVSGAMASGKYYETPSEGFVWPLPVPTPTEEGQYD